MSIGDIENLALNNTLKKLRCERDSARALNRLLLQNVATRERENRALRDKIEELEEQLRSGISAD